MKFTFKLFGLLCAALLVSDLKYSSAANSDNGNADGFIEPFNGKDFDGWVIEGNKTFKDGDQQKPVWSIKDGVIHIARHKGFGFLRYEEELKDFELRLEYRQEPKSNSGIGIRYD